MSLRMTRTSEFGTFLPCQPRRAMSGFKGESSRAAEILRRQRLTRRRHEHLGYLPLANIFVTTRAFDEALTSRATNVPPTGPDWVHEIKHDGYRLMARRQ